MRIKKISFLVLVSILALGLLAGCNYYDTNKRNLTKGYNSPDGLSPYTYDNNNGMNYNRYGTRTYDNTNRYGYTNNYAPNNRYYANQYSANVNQDSDRMANVASNVSGVQNATVVIAGRTAYVGLNLKDQVQTDNAQSVEANVYRALKKYSNNYNIRISSDADLFGQLRDIGDGIRNGTPINQYQNDFNNFRNQFRTSYP